mmetsp:Transcript_12551/g.30463  ORF Transcript_12551/g.30463 Transcript_12551/m.30463 type:complete len:231 (-) Transcript_12551:63-755(-)
MSLVALMVGLMSQARQAGASVGSARDAANPWNAAVAYAASSLAALRANSGPGHSANADDVNAPPPPSPPQPPPLASPAPRNSHSSGASTPAVSRTRAARRTCSASRSANGSRCPTRLTCVRSVASSSSRISAGGGSDPGPPSSSSSGSALTSSLSAAAAASDARPAPAIRARLALRGRGCVVPLETTRVRVSARRKMPACCTNGSAYLGSRALMSRHRTWSTAANCAMPR